MRPQAHDKHDVVEYTLTNAPFIGLAGLVAGLQEAFYKFEVRAQGSVRNGAGSRAAQLALLRQAHQLQRAQQHVLHWLVCLQKMPPPVTRRSVAQAASLLYIIGRKTLFGTALGATFCYVEASLENSRGVHDVYNGVAGGAAAGLLFGLLPPKPWPQPLAWPLFFGLSVAAADLVAEGIPYTTTGFRWVFHQGGGFGQAGRARKVQRSNAVMRLHPVRRHWGTIPNRPNWGDPEPPRPPILQTGAAARPINKNFNRGE